MRLPLLFLISVSIFGACTSTENMQTQSFERGPDITEINTTLSILDHLKRVPGLTISQSGDDIGVFMRGVSTLYGENNVLFVVDGTPVGHRYFDLIHIVDVYDVQDIKLLRSSMGSQFYGMRGANGVVEITTKK